MKSQDEIVSAYISKLEEENKELKKRKVSYFIDFSGVRCWFEDWWGLFFVLPLFGCILYLLGNVIMSSKMMDSFYLDYNSHERKFCVRQEVDWDRDEWLGCYEDQNDAIASAKKFRESWLKLRSAENE